MFDRGLISLADDHSILTAPDRIPDELQRLINADHQLRPPVRSEFLPHPQFLEYHREHVFQE